MNALRPVPAVDGLLAATALVHGLRLVTHNAQDFIATAVPVIDPSRLRRPAERVPRTDPASRSDAG